MFDTIGGVRRSWHPARTPAQQWLGRRLDTMRRDADGMRQDVLSSAAQMVPALGRRQRTSRAMIAAPIVAVAGLVAAVGVLLWDERRRTAVRQRLQEVAESVHPDAS